MSREDALLGEHLTAYQRSRRRPHRSLIVLGARQAAESKPMRRFEVATHDLRDVLLGQALELVDEGDRVGHALGVGVVRPEEHPVGAEELDEAHGVLLVERVDVDVALEHLDRVLVE